MTPAETLSQLSQTSASSYPAFALAGRKSRKRRWPLVLCLAVAVALAGALAWYWAPIRSTAQTAASVGARLGCSCHYIAGRDLGQCRADFETGMGPVVLSANEEAKSVTARYPLLSTQTATYRAGEGCVLEGLED